MLGIVFLVSSCFLESLHSMTFLAFSVADERSKIIPISLLFFFHELQFPLAIFSAISLLLISDILMMDMYYREVYGFHIAWVLEP